MNSLEYFNIIYLLHRKMCVDNSNEHELEEDPIPHVLTADSQ